MMLSFMEEQVSWLKIKEWMEFDFQNMQKHQLLYETGDWRPTINVMWVEFWLLGKWGFRQPGDSYWEVFTTLFNVKFLMLFGKIDGICKEFSVRVYGKFYFLIDESDYLWRSLNATLYILIPYKGIEELNDSRLLGWWVEESSIQLFQVVKFWHFSYCECDHSFKAKDFSQWCYQ